VDYHIEGKVVPTSCQICARGCLIREGGTGACGLYKAREGRVIEMLADRYLVACPISIETMPMLHYHPGGKFLQISTTGCNFNCPGCISTVIVREMPRDSSALQRLDARQVVDKALASQCLGIAFLMNDPLASWPTFLRVAETAHAEKLLVGCSSNAYFSHVSLEQVLPYLDFINIGMKGFSDQSYRDCGASSGIGPVLENLKTLHQAGVHIEISCIFRKGAQDELRALADFIADISPRIPLQIMRFIPFEGAGISQETGISEAEEFCRELRGSLDHVYLFNTPGTEYLHTPCPHCGENALRRDFYGPMGAKLLSVPEASKEPGRPERCRHCRGELDYVGQASRTPFQEGDFEGGYPFTRALEMVEAMLIAMGVERKQDIARAWEYLLNQFGLARLHREVQQPVAYIAALRHFGRVVSADRRAEELAAYLEDKLERITAALSSVSERPRVYYAMGKPLFFINSGRLENQLVEWAGGLSVNKELTPGGRPGHSLSVDQLNKLAPDIIFISAFISNTVDDFYADCLRLGIEVKAVANKRIYVHPAPGWDFGSPRWVLGLMHMATVFHPRHCKFDVMKEAETFYERFYGMEFKPQEVNRSFAKPSGLWRWAAPDLPHKPSAVSTSPTQPGENAS
jgi:pyruvate formate lyase activating enzyme